MDLPTQIREAEQGEWAGAYLDHDRLLSAVKRGQTSVKSKGGRASDSERRPLLESEHSSFEGLYRSEVQRVDDFYSERLHEAQDQVEALLEQFKSWHRQKASEEPKNGVWHRFRRLTRTRAPNRDWHAAREDLRFSTYIIYRRARLLERYAKTNESGFRETAKLSEGGPRSQAARQLTDCLEKAAFSSRVQLKELSETIKEEYADNFCHGDLLNALIELSPHKTTQSHHYALWRAGLFTGIGSLLVVMGYSQSQDPTTHKLFPNTVPLLQIYAAIGLPIILGLLLIVNLSFWHKYKINYALIFSFDRRTFVGSLVFAEIPAAVFAVFATVFWLTWQKNVIDYVPPTTLPLILAGLLVFWLFLPLPILWPSARGWFLRSCSRVLTCGVVDLEFRDFWLGDMFTTVYYSLTRISLVVCAYKSGWKGDIESKCDPNLIWWTAILASIPFAIRALQSVRRYIDLKKRLHWLNVARFCVSIIFQNFYFAWRRHGSQHDVFFVLWLLFGTINAIYSGLWDIIVDWNLRPSMHDMRQGKPKLYPAWAYPVAILVNMTLRFAFLLYLSPVASNTAEGFIEALCEVARRILWNNLRLEAEQLGNLDQYRATNDVRFPYNTGK